MATQHTSRVSVFTIAFSVLISISFCACCHYPKAQVAHLMGNKPDAPTITVVAYGDTRTGPWGLGDNEKQALHGKVVDDIFANNGYIDAVIFTGDAVMTNFPLWKKAYWRCFLTQSDRFRRANIPFYPSLGNHEVLSPIVPLMKTAGLATTEGAAQALAEQDFAKRVALAYDAGERASANPPPTAAAVAQTLDPSSKIGQTLLSQWEQGVAKGDAASANQFGQFEGHLQRTFYASGKDERCGTDSNTISDSFLKQAKYDYLRPLLQGRSYYSKTLENGGIRVKLIALDTNCLDSAAQQDFFAAEVKSAKEPIIVFGHHPPVNYDKPGASWDLVPGWGRRDDEGMKRYITTSEGSKIALWIFGHVHDYQRRGPAARGQAAVSPVLLVAGGGGASPPDEAPADFQWQPGSWPPPFSKAVYNQVKVSVTATSINVEVRGRDNGAATFKMIDSFSIPLAAGAYK